LDAGACEVAKGTEFREAGEWPMKSQPFSNQLKMSRDFTFIVFSEINLPFKNIGTRRVAFSILEGAIKAFNKYGIESATLKQISVFSGFKIDHIRNHFKSLKNLKMICAKYCRVLYQRYVIEKMNVAVSYEKLFEIYFAACLDWSKNFGAYSKFWLKMLSISVANPELKTLNTEAVDVGLQRLVLFIKQGVEKKAFSCEDCEKAARLIHIVITGLLLSATTQDNLTDFDIFKTECCQILGIKSRNLLDYK
jgi:hypothetical protein